MSISSKHISDALDRTLLSKVADRYSLSFKDTYVKDEIFKEEYQNKIINCMIKEVDDNHIQTPETDSSVVCLEHTKKGIIKLPNIKGNTYLVDSEGNPTSEFTHGCRLVSVGDRDNKLKFRSRSSNLVKYMELGGYDDTGNKREGSLYSTARCPEPIHIGKGGTFYAWMDKNGQNHITSAGVWYHAFDGDMNYTRSFNGYSTSYTLQENEEYIVFRTHMQYYEFQKGNMKMMISLTPITKYVNYEESLIEVDIGEPLRRVPDGGVYDEIVDNKLIRRVGYLEYKGSETGCHLSNPDKDGKYYYISIGDIKGQDARLNCKIFNNYGLPYRNPYSDPFKGVFIWRNFRIRTKDNSHDTVDNVLSQFSSNSFQIVYELETPIVTEIVPSVSIPSYEFETYIVSDNEVQPTVTYSYDANITFKSELSEQAKEVNDNKCDIDNNIVPYLMDIEYQILLMS